MRVAHIRDTIDVMRSGKEVRWFYNSQRGSHSNSIIDIQDFWHLCRAQLFSWWCSARLGSISMLSAAYRSTTDRMNTNERHFRWPKFSCWRRMSVRQFRQHYEHSTSAMTCLNASSKRFTLTGLFVLFAPRRRHFSIRWGVDPTGDRSYPPWNYPHPQEILVQSCLQ